MKNILYILFAAAVLISCSKCDEKPEFVPVLTPLCKAEFPKNNLVDSNVVSFSRSFKTNKMTAENVRINGGKPLWLYAYTPDELLCDSIPYINDSANTAPFKQPDINVDIPKQFTPNGDGINDTYQIGIVGNLYKYKFRIFNRFGQIVFESSNPNYKWDGGNNASNVFVYSIEMECFGLDDLVLYRTTRNGKLSLIK